MSRSTRCWGWAALLVLGLLPLRASGQVAAPDTLPPLDLTALLRQVRAQNPDLAARRLGAEALATRSAQVSALPDPTAAVTVQPFPVLTARGAQRTQLRAEQPIPFPGKRALRGRIADLRADAAELEADALADDLAVQTQRAYYDLYRAQQQGQLVRRFRCELRDFEDAATIQYEVGRGPQQSILKAQIERGRLSVRLEQLAADAQAAREALARLTNQPASAVQGRAVADTSLHLPPPDSLAARALARRPETAAVRHAQERARQQIALARRAFLPDFSVSATYFDIAARSMPPTADGRDALALSLGVKIPLWRGSLRANLEEARLEAQQIDAQYEALGTTIRAQIGDLAARLQRQRRQLALLRQTLIPQAETTREATLSAYTTGRTGFLDLLDAERTLFSLRMDAVETQARVLQTAAALSREAGLDPLSARP